MPSSTITSKSPKRTELLRGRYSLIILNASSPIDQAWLGTGYQLILGSCTQTVAGYPPRSQAFPMWRRRTTPSGPVRGADSAETEQDNSTISDTASKAADLSLWGVTASS